MTLLDKQVAIWGRKGWLFGLHIDLTYRCPLRCRHCYLQGRQHTTELTTKQLFTLLGQAAAMHVVAVTFSGGEILVRKDLEEILSEAQRLGFVVLLKTSGFGATKRTASTFAKKGVKGVDVSLYSHTAKSHDALTRVKGSFNAAISLILQLQDASVPVQAALTPMPGYCDDPRVTVDELKKSGIHHIKTNSVSDAFCDGANISQLLPDETIVRRQLEASGAWPPTTPQPHNPQQRPCGAGSRELYLAPDGDIWPCPGLPLSVGHFPEQSLQEVWEQSPRLKEIQGIQWKDLPQCSQCDLAPFCHFCMGKAFHEHGDFRAPAQELCRYAGILKRLTEEES